MIIISRREKLGQLCEAVLDNNIALVEQLLQLRHYSTGNSPNDDYDLHRAFWYATAKNSYFSANNNFPLSQMLLQHGADPDTRFETGSSVLHNALEAAHSGRGYQEETLSFVRLLLEHGADPNIGRNGSGETPLTLAVYAYQLEVIRLLLERGARVNDPSTSHHQSNTPLGIIVGYKSNPFGTSSVRTKDIVKLLLQYGANANQQPCCCKGGTPLHRACRWGLPEVVSLLLKRGANLRLTDKFQRTPLFDAINNDDHKLKILKILLDHAGGDGGTDLLLTARTKTGVTPLHAACYNNNGIIKADQIQFIKILLQHGAPLDAVDNHGRSPLDVVARTAPKIRDCKSVKIIISLLLEHGATTTTRNCVSALHCVAKINALHPTLCELIRHGANVQARCPQYQKLPLDYACEYGNLDNIYELVHAMIGKDCTILTPNNQETS